MTRRWSGSRQRYALLAGERLACAAPAAQRHYVGAGRSEEQEMRDIANVEVVIERLRPHMARIEEHFNHENEKFKALLARDHDDLGRVLKCHLILERYIDEFLLLHLGIADIERVRLTFFQKAQLLPDANPKIGFIKPGIIEFNAIRNRYGHDLDAEIRLEHTRDIDAVLRIAREGMECPSLLQKVEMFTTIAATFLLVSPKDIEELFERVFREARLS
jgi:hypothetical protein